jgi:predicted homoserine dehydrogenase-like protein
VRAEVVCKAKRRIHQGEHLGGIGGTDWYGHIMTRQEAVSLRAIPIGIAERAIAKRTIEKHSVITEGDIILDDTTFIYRLRKLQESLLED